MSDHRVFAAVYDRFTAGAERRGLTVKRGELIAPLRGTIVEVGAGTGANLPWYRDLTQLTLIEPDRAMRQRLQRRLAGTQLSFPVEVISASVGDDALSLATSSVDAVVSTLVLCSVRDQLATLREIARILKPDGLLMLIEHVRGRGLVASAQRALSPVQRLCAGGCRLDRNTRNAVERAGFDATDVTAWRLPGSLPLLGCAIVGTARLTSTGERHHDRTESPTL